jgi:predicted nucleic acid-binding protein
MAMTSTQKSKVYADTSVFGGVFDEEFERPSRAFFDAVRDDRFLLVTSELVRQEVKAAPQSVQNLFHEMLPLADIAEITADALNLQQSYIKSGIVPEKYSTDALHVALATTAQVSLIVSWNFKHIVNFQKIPLYNAANVLNGYREITIYSPLEVIEYED